MILARIKAVAIPAVVTLLAGGMVGMWIGAAVSKGHYETILHKQAVAYAKAWQGELASERAQARSAQDEAVRNARERARIERESTEVLHEITNDPAAMPGCEWRDPHRLRIERLYRIHGLAGPAAGPAP